MSMKTLIAAILAEAKEVTKNENLKMKDIMEWSTGDLVPHPGEKLYHLPKMEMNIAVKVKS